MIVITRLPHYDADASKSPFLIANMTRREIKINPTRVGLGSKNVPEQGEGRTGEGDGTLFSG